MIAKHAGLLLLGPCLLFWGHGGLGAVGERHLDVPSTPDVRLLSSEAGRGLTHVLTLERSTPGALAVEYRTVSGPWLRMASTAEGRTHRLVLTRLRPDADYQWVARAGQDSLSGSFRSPALPSDLAELSFAAEGRLGAPLVLLEPSRPGGFSGPVVVDGSGAVVWYHRTAGDIHGMARRASGSFVLLDVGNGLVEVTASGDTLAFLPSSDEREMHHDVTIAPDGAVLFLARDPRTVDGVRVIGEAVWRWGPETGRTERIWSAFDHLSFETDRADRSRPQNWLHANSLAVGPRGNLVISLSYLDQVVSIGASGQVEWRLGGPNATVTPTGEPFSGQHSSSEVAPGRVLLFDNGYDEGRAPRGPSRAVEYDLGPSEAHPVWSFEAPNGNRARVVSSALRMASGNTLVTFGPPAGLRGSTGPIEVYEVDPGGRVAWHLGVKGPIRTLYRATPLNTVGGEREVVGR